MSRPQRQQRVILPDLQSAHIVIVKFRQRADPKVSHLAGQKIKSIQHTVAVRAHTSEIKRAVVKQCSWIRKPTPTAVTCERGKIGLGNSQPCVQQQKKQKYDRF